MTKYNEIELYQHQIFGVRKVLRSHTTYHRLSNLLSKIGYDIKETFPYKIAVVYEYEQTKNIVNSFKRQTLQNKDLISLDELKEKYTEYDYVAFFCDKYEYGEFYLEDMVNGFKYTNSTYVTKDSYYNGREKIEGIENDYINAIKDYNRTVFSTKYFDYEFLQSLNHNIELENGYSIDSLEINLKKGQALIHAEFFPKFTIVIPTFNNGDHLYSKCFMSLRRSSMFQNMEIIIVDDGSTDNYTTKIVARLERLYPNIRSYFFQPGGSGSASRPRNKGVELSTTDYITFLDPDNEAINDGYTKLYNNITKTNCEVVIGNIIKADSDTKTVDYFNFVKDRFPNQSYFTNEEAHEFLIETSFRVQSIQALMIKKESLLRNKILMVEGAVGEDTLFFYELLVKAKDFLVVQDLIHVYYAGVEGSAVNFVTVKTFEKYKLLEQKKFNFLRNNNLLYGYMELRFNYYFKNWFLNKLKLVESTERFKAEKLLYQIYTLYKNHLPTQVNNSVKEFAQKFDEMC